MRTVYEAEHVLDAQLVRDALEGAGIRAFVFGDALTGGIGMLPTCGLVTVRVAEPDLEEATRIVEALRAELSEAGVEPDPGTLGCIKPA